MVTLNNAEVMGYWTIGLMIKLTMVRVTGVIEPIRQIVRCIIKCNPLFDML